MIRFIIIAISALLLAYCRTHTSAVTESNSLSARSDTIFFARELVDSIFLRDSIFVNQYVRGDTVYIEKTAQHIIARERTKTDTIYRTRTDTVFSSISYERTEKQDKLPLKLYIALAVLVCMIILYIYIETRKK